MLQKVVMNYSIARILPYEKDRRGRINSNTETPRRIAQEYLHVGICSVGFGIRIAVHFDSAFIS